MATTTNFGWETPDDTDLVKDGAAAMRTLGNSIDASFVDLKGGTTGQILSKASNTDLDYTWITNDVGDITNVAVTSPITGGGSSGSVTIGIQDGTTAQKGAVQLENSTSSTSTTTAAVPASVKSAYDLANAAIPKSLVDAAGDLIYATANDTVARLAIGTAGQVLKVNSGATAPEWGTAGAVANYSLLNAGGTALTGAATITVSGISAKSSLYILVQLASSANASSEIRLRFNSDNTSKYMQNTIPNFTDWDTNAPNSFTEIKLGIMGNSATSRVLANVFLEGGNSSGLKIGHWHSSYDGSAGTRQLGSYVYSGTSTISSISLISSTGNFDNGTLYVYGSEV